MPAGFLPAVRQSIRKHLPALCSAARENLAAVAVGHPFAEAVFFAAMAFFRLVCSFHVSILRSNCYIQNTIKK
jgi:hypothetical protein